MSERTRERSLWAWGWREKFPDDAARGGLAQLARAMLPSAQPALRRLPSDQVVVPPPAVGVPAAIADLVSQAPRDRAIRTRGRAFPDLVAGFAGDYGGAPAMVARPRTDAEVARVLEVAAAHGWAVVPFGGGTSVVGGVDAELARGDRPAVDQPRPRCARRAFARSTSRSRLARIGAGTLGPALEAELEAHGLTLRHFPQSFEFSTLGGWLATRAGGHYATGPTRIDELAHALTLVAPRGDPRHASPPRLRRGARGGAPGARLRGRSSA